MSAINKASINVCLNNKASFSVYGFGQKASFNVCQNNKTSFNLIIFGVNLLEKYLFKPKMKINLSFYGKLKSTANSVIKAGKYNLLMTNVSELLLGNSLINFHQIFSFYLRERLKGTGSVTHKIDIIPNPKQKFSNSVSSTSKINLGFSPSTKHPYLLSDHDSKTLAEMDAMLLRELDYYIDPDDLLDDDGNTLIDDDSNVLEA